MHVCLPAAVQDVTKESNSGDSFGVAVVTASHRLFVPSDETLLPVKGCGGRAASLPVRANWLETRQSPDLPKTFPNSQSTRPLECPSVRDCVSSRR